MKTRPLAGLSLAAVALFAPDARPQGLGTELVASGLSSPLDLRSPPGDARLFVAEQTGAVRIIENGALLPTPYYDASGLVAFGNFTGLRAIQFHPDYAGNGYMYFVYDEVEQLLGDVVLARVTVSATDPYTADPSSYVELLRVTQTEAWHGGGCMNFGPDGYLYVAFGDGYGHGFDPLCHSQDPEPVPGQDAAPGRGRRLPLRGPRGQSLRGQPGGAGRDLAPGPAPPLALVLRRGQRRHVDRRRGAGHPGGAQLRPGGHLGPQLRLEGHGGHPLHRHQRLSGDAGRLRGRGLHDPDPDPGHHDGELLDRRGLRLPRLGPARGAGQLLLRRILHG